jgi:hypothetical protein
MVLPFVPGLALIVAMGCGASAGDPGDVLESDTSEDVLPSDPGVDGVMPDFGLDPGPDGSGDPGPDSSVDPGPFEWPVPTGPVSITPSSEWKNEVGFPEDPFLTREYDDSYRPLAGWIKFSVLMRDPSKVYYQDGRVHPFHYGFATSRLDPFAGRTHQEFEALSMRQEGQEVVLGAVIYPPDSAVPEYGVQLVRLDPYHPEMVRILLELVRASIVPEGPATMFYFPTYEQQESARRHAGFFLQHGIEVSSVDRWAGGNHCYVPGWALGRLVRIPGSELESAYADGRLRPDDILLTDGVPAEVPFVAGILSDTQSTPNSHVAILAQSFGIPFAALSLESDRLAAGALVGREVVLRVQRGWGECRVRLEDASDLPDDIRDDLLEMKKAPEARFPGMAALGRLSDNVDDLGRGDVKHFGGKASHYGILRRSIPDNSDPAVAFSFDLWRAYLDQTVEGGQTLAQVLEDRLGGYSWPPPMDSLTADLSWIRAFILENTEVPTAIRGGIVDALGSFDPMRRLRFRSSTNVEDTETFVGAGLYDSYSGCLADDTDGDDLGPGICDPSRSQERGVFQAIRKVLASFYNTNAFIERLRRGVPESDAGMALLVHHSFPDDDELANGVAIVTRPAWGGLYIQLSSQAGATSVANPDGGAQPELVTVSVSSDGSAWLTMAQRSSLVPLGGSVMDWEGDYKGLVDLLKKASNRFGTETGKSEFVLDFEYKKMKPGRLVVKQIRELPAADATPVLPTMVMPGTVRQCVFQGEYGDVWANHRAKSRWTISTRALWSSRTANATPLAYVAGELRVAGEPLVREGDPSTFPGAFHRFQDGSSIDGWSEASGLGIVMRTALPEKASPVDGPCLFWDELWTDLEMKYDNPVPVWNSWEDMPGTTESEWVRLAACTGREDVTASHMKQSRTYALPDGVTVNTTYYWPPPPTGITAGYTAPLIAWESTVIEGLATLPIILESEWAQTYRPGHHNFSEDFLFEPGLDPGVPVETLAELEAMDIRAIHFVGAWNDISRAVIMGLDGSLREWK